MQGLTDCLGSLGLGMEGSGGVVAFHDVTKEHFHRFDILFCVIE